MLDNARMLDGISFEDGVACCVCVIYHTEAVIDT